MKKITLVLVALLIASSAFAMGQAGFDLAVLNAGVGARPLGMGSAFTAVADNADAPYWNPGGLGWIRGNEITTMQTRLSSDTDYYYLSYVQSVFGGTLGISWIQIGISNISQTSSEVDVHNEVQNASVFNYSSNAYLIAYGKALNDRVSLGFTAKYLSSNMRGVMASGYSLTPGILLRLAPITMGVKVDDLLSQQQWETGAVEVAPPKIRFGLTYKPQNIGLLAIDFAQTVRQGYSPEFSVGYEYAVDGLSLRLGYADGLTAGAGFQVNHTRVDYAYVTQRELSKDNVHRISLSGIW